MLADYAIDSAAHDEIKWQQARGVPISYNKSYDDNSNNDNKDKKKKKKR